VQKVVQAMYKVRRQAQKKQAEPHVVVFSASGSSDRSTQSLLEVTTRVAPPAVRKISIPFVMPFSLVVTRWLRAARQRLS